MFQSFYQISLYIDFHTFYFSGNMTCMNYEGNGISPFVQNRIAYGIKQNNKYIVMFSEKNHFVMENFI